MFVKNFTKIKLFKDFNCTNKNIIFELIKLIISMEKKTEKIEKLLNRVKWKDLYDGIPCRIHGDLQFDNILITNDKKFKLIDYRDNFGGKIEYGDKYYDLAKLYGGMILNYSLIKKINLNTSKALKKFITVFQVLRQRKLKYF